VVPGERVVVIGASWGAYLVLALANRRADVVAGLLMSVPVVHEPVTLEKLLQDWPRERRLLMADESGGGKPIATALRDLAASEKQAPWAILIGPEGGFHRDELDLLGKLDFVTPVGLGPRILRADTAALAALSCWQALAGDWERPTPRLPLDYKRRDAKES